MKLTYPFAVIDFEATSLEMDSFPIEVGVAIAHAPSNITTWSAIIEPAKGWNIAEAWEPAAERVHNIVGKALAAGEPVDEVMKRLNELLGPVGHAWCDGGAYDQHWFRRLCQASRVKSTFRLWDIGGLFVLDRRAHNRFAEALSKSEAPHRAGADAARVCGALSCSIRG